jgi:hypothetical protein
MVQVVQMVLNVFGALSDFIAYLLIYTPTFSC